jgi:hypothetical protein
MTTSDIDEITPVSTATNAPHLLMETSGLEPPTPSCKARLAAELPESYRLHDRWREQNVKPLEPGE